MAFRLGPRDLVWRFAVIAAGIGLHHAGVDSEPLALDQAGRHAGYNDTLEYVAENIALPEPVQPVLRKSRVMRNLVIKVEPTKPAIRQMQLDFLRQPALRAQTVTVPNNQHPDHQFRINRWPTDLAVVGLQPLVHIGERRHHKTIDTPQQVVLRDAIIEMELIEKACLIAAPPTHHRRLRDRDP